MPGHDDERLDPAPATSASDPATRWIGVLFAIGSVCFLVGPFPGFVELVGSEVDAFVFFAGSLFFTCAALLQLLHSSGRLGRVASVVQFAGTLFFNVSTFHALQGRARHDGIQPPRVEARSSRLALLRSGVSP